jgi:hypothetical protein
VARIAATDRALPASVPVHAAGIEDVGRLVAQDPVSQPGGQAEGASRNPAWPGQGDG